MNESRFTIIFKKESLLTLFISKINEMINEMRDMIDELLGIYIIEEIE